MPDAGWIARVVLVWISVAHVGPAQERAGIQILVVGAPGADARRGIELGVAEMAQTANLLKRDVRLVHKPATGEALDGVILALGGRHTTGAGVPQVYLGDLPKGAGPCSFTVATPARDRAVTWHPSLNRYGASELNERYVKRHGHGMTADAYSGWIAVKALVEAALRPVPANGKCAALGRLRFDGHKGRPLTFDPVSRVLQQPLYVVEGGRASEARR